MELQGKRIFIVEDDVPAMAVFAVTLKQAGAFIIQDAWNVNTIPLLIKHLPVDIILMDLMLRYDISGYEIFDKIRSQPPLARIPILAVSACDPDIEIPKLKEKGFIGFIDKPINVLTFASQISDCLKGNQAWYY